MHFIFPYNFVYWTEVINHQRIKQKYLNSIIKISKNWGKHPHFFADVKTSFDNFNDNNFSDVLMSDDEFLNEVIWNPFDKMMGEDFFIFDKPKQSYLQQIWFNCYNPGQEQEVHDHNGFGYTENKKTVVTNYSGIYILDLQEENTTVFYNPGPCPGSSNPGGISFRANEVTEGQVLFFPSNLLHYVLPCKNFRSTIAFNITSIYQN